MPWKPTDTFLKGKIVKPFLPFDKHPDLVNDNLRNLYPGDEVYVFEVSDNSKWARGYVVSKPFPNDFTITSVNPDDIPRQNVNIVVFPMKYVQVIEEVPLTQSLKIEDVEIEDSTMPPIENLELGPGPANGKINGIKKTMRLRIPPLPINDFSTGDDLIGEIKYTLELLTSQIFALYSIGEFRLFNELTPIYYNLDETRLKLLTGTLTTNETQVAKETATFLLSKIPKKLASKSARLNTHSYDLENQDTDVSGYKAILARDALSGTLLSNENAIPSRIALNQTMCALEPKFPIDAHHHELNYSLAPQPNKRFNHEPPSHILIDFKSVSGSSVYQPPGFAGMTAYLYIRNNRKRLTEAFAVHTDSVDGLLQVEKISGALFKNIPSTEIDIGRVYLVAVLTEEIDLNAKDISNIPHANKIKKGVAAGVTDITKVISRKGKLGSSEPHLFSIRLFGSYMDQKKASTKSSPYEIDGVINNGWGEIIDRIIAGSNQGIAVNPRAENLIVTVKEFKYKLEGSTNNILTTATPISRIKPIFFDPLAENYERIYLKVGKISLLDQTNRDDLLTIEVSAPNNDLITFSEATNQEEKPKWQFVSVFSDEFVGEVIKINGASLKNPSKKYLNDDHIVLFLYINGILVGEGKILYRSGNKLVEFNKNSHKTEINSVRNKLPTATVEISTEYIGKVYNSDIVIDNIFQYEQLVMNGEKGIEELSNTLVRFNTLSLDQLLRYFTELLRSLFGIAHFSSGQPQSDVIANLQENTFNAIIYLLDTVFGKQDRFLYLIPEFTENNMEIPPIGPFIFYKIAENFLKVETNWNSTSRSLCRIISFLVKFAISSMENETVLDEYYKSLKQLFKGGSYFLSVHSTSLINDQVLILEILDYVISYKLRIDDLEALKFVVRFIDSIGIRGLGVDEEVHSTQKPLSKTKDHKIIISKLLLIHRLFGTFLVHSPVSRKIIVTKAIEWAMEVLLGPTDVDASRLACSILNAVCTLLWKKVHVDGNKEDIIVCHSLTVLLPAISRTISKYNKFTRGNEYFKSKRNFTRLFPNEYPFKEYSMDPIVNDEIIVELMAELATIFCFIAKIGNYSTGTGGYDEILNSTIENELFDPSKYLIDNFQGKDLISVISGINIIRQGKFIPEKKWFSIYALFVEGCLVSLELIRPLLKNYYIPSVDNTEAFDRVLWGNYLKSLLKLATLGPVSLEHLSDVPRKACHQITGTMRNRIALLVEEAWDSLAWDATEENYVRFNLHRFGGYQLRFVNTEYSILHDLMLFALQQDSRCQLVAVKVLWSIIASEIVIRGSIIDIEKECLVGLHHIYERNGYRPSEVEQQRFIDLLTTTTRFDVEDEAFDKVHNFIESLEGFLGVLNDFNSVPVGPEFDDDRTFHNLTIKAHLKNANKPELFNSFINSMYERNIGRGDHVQAALSLELLASTHTWDHNTILGASLRPKFPQQSSFERREALYYMIADNYITGNRLERATDTYNELLDSYNQHTYDLKSFANVHNKLAKLYLDLESSDKLSPSFFRVAFIGAGFPKNIRGKEQIYEGLPFEHITSIHERLLKLYPGARIISDDAEAQKLKEKIQTGRYLHVSVVEPVNEISDRLFNTSIGVRQYARNKDLRFFSSLKKLPGATSVHDLWTEETTYETYLSFPTLMNRSEVKESRVVTLSPLENAIRTVVNRNNELIQTESSINHALKEKSDHSAFFIDLSRQLAGTVDSPVNGGVGQYRNFFYDDEYRNDKHLFTVKLLKEAFNELATILNRCLHLHGKIVPANMKSSQDALVDLYKNNFREEIENLNLTTNYESDYSHSISYHTSVSSPRTDRPNTSGVSTASAGYTSTRLSRSPSRNSSTSGNSAPSTRNSVSNSGSKNVFNYRNKRTALNWKMANRNDQR